jgi:hypothetical protein
MGNGRGTRQAPNRPFPFLLSLARDAVPIANDPSHPLIRSSVFPLRQLGRSQNSFQVIAASPSGRCPPSFAEVGLRPDPEFSFVRAERAP